MEAIYEFFKAKSLCETLEELYPTEYKDESDRRWHTRTKVLAFEIPGNISYSSTINADRNVFYLASCTFSMLLALPITLYLKKVFPMSLTLMMYVSF